MDGFKFKLGDLVVTKGSIQEAELHSRAKKFSIPPCGQVVQRMTDECSAGVQRHYGVSIRGDCRRVHENELVLHSEWVAEGFSRLVALATPSGG